MKVDGKIVLRVFEIRSKYNFHTRKFEQSLKEFLRFIPGEGVFLNNSIHFYFWNERIDHNEKITSWRKYNGNKVMCEMPIYPYNKKALYKNTPLEYAPLDEFKQNYHYYSEYDILDIANHPSFEFLWKMGLHRLSLDSKKFTKKGDFQKRFGVPKNFLPFMVENNINYEQYIRLKLLQKPDIDLINKYRYFDYNYLVLMKKQGYIDNLEVIKKYEYKEQSLRTICKYTTLKKFLNYKQGIENINVYADYLKMADKISYSIKAKDRLFPKDLIAVHDELSNKIRIMEDAQTQFAVAIRYLELSKYTYSDDKYIIFPAPSVDDFKDEAKQQGNCVASTYMQPFIKGHTEIYFIRELSNPTKSFITLEYNNQRIRQRELPNHKTNFTQEQLDFMDKWIGFRQFTEQREKYRKRKQIQTERYDLTQMVA